MAMTNPGNAIRRPRRYEGVRIFMVDLCFSRVYACRSPKVAWKKKKGRGENPLPY
jgi:hypothetical protein